MRQLRNIFSTQLQKILKDSSVRDALLMVLSGAVNGAGGFVFWFAAARLYSPTMIGVASAGSAVVTLLSGFSCLGFGVGLIRYHNALGLRYKQRIITIFMATLLAACFTAILFSQVGPLVARGLQPAFRSSSDVLVFVASCVATALSLQYDSYLLSRRLLVLLVIRNLFLVGSRALLLLLPIQSPALLIGTTGLSAAISLIIVLPWSLRPHVVVVESVIPEVATSTLVRFSLWNGLTGLAQTMSTFIVPVIAVSIVGASEGAAFYMAWSLINVLLLIPTALSFILLIEKSATPSPGSLSNSGGFQRDGLTLLATVLFLPFATAVLYLLGPTYLLNGLMVLLVLAIGVWPNLRSQLMVTTLRLGGSQGLLALLYLTNQIVIIGSSIVFLHVVGIIGAAIAWTLGQFFLIVALQWGIRRTAVMI